MTEQKPQPISKLLTLREYAIAGLVGHSNEVIALHFGISPQTVKNHLTSIFNKTGCDTRAMVAFRYEYELRVSLEAELAQVKAERDALAKRLGKPRCLDCNAAGMMNCSHFDNRDGQWEYSLERLCRELAVGLQRVEHRFKALLAYKSVPDASETISEAKALLSRPEVKKILEGV